MKVNNVQTYFAIITTFHISNFAARLKLIDT